MKPVKWGVLGVSKHYRQRVSNGIRNSEISDVKAIASRSLERAQKEARELGIAKAYGSYEELLKDPEIEAVYIPLPNHIHAEWVKKAADQGKHVLCEKPFSMSAETTRETIEYARGKGVLIMEAFMYKLHPQWVHARDLIRAGEIGALRSIHTFFSYNLQDPNNIRNKLEAGGGGIPDIGCYAVSGSRFLTGREPERVISLIQRSPELKTDIVSSAILDFSGLRAVFTVSTQAFPYQRVQAFGSGGVLEIDVPFNIYPDVSCKVEVTTGVGRRTIMNEVADMYKIEFDAFSRSIRKGDPLPIAAEDAVLNQKVLDALYESEKTGAWVSL